MGRGMTGVVEALHDDVSAASDHRLVAAVREGDDRAFEQLYQRYQRRIGAYVMGMVKDHGRAEDITQDVFMSALRRMRETERPIAFKPWIYEIARNACIDAHRRSRRAEEVSFDADELLAPADHRRLAATGPTPDAAVTAKQELETLCGAFGGLSQTHHEILVLRELEGLSYRQIGERMGMSRPAVESTLFRARRRLTEEYDELVSGARCRRIQCLIHTAADGAVGTRDARKLARHLAHCQPCRREAVGRGLDMGVLVKRPARARVARKVAAWLPFPALFRGRRGDGGSGCDQAAGYSGQPVIVHLSTLSDQLGAGWGKLAAAAALLLAGAGVGITEHAVRAQSGPATVKPAARAAAGAPAAARNVARGHGATTARQAAATHTRATKHGRRLTGMAHRGAGLERRRAGLRARMQLPRATQPPSRGGASAGSSGGGSVSTGTAPTGSTGPLRMPTQTAVPVPAVPKLAVPDTAPDVVGAVQQAAGTVEQTAAGTVEQTAQQVGPGVVGGITK